jgi:hypothetical protein
LFLDLENYFKEHKENTINNENSEEREEDNGSNNMIQDLHFIPSSHQNLGERKDTSRATCKILCHCGECQERMPKETHVKYKYSQCAEN